MVIWSPIDRQDLRAALESGYGLRDVTLAPAPRGFVAETYIVTAGEGRYFAKLVTISRYSENIEASLPALLEMRQQGIDAISYPIPARDGQLSMVVDGRLLVLFNYIDGQWTFDYPFADYVRLLAQVHAMTGRITRPPAHEDFALAFRDDLLRHLETVWTGAFTHPVEREVQTLMHGERDRLRRDFATMESLMREMQQAGHERVLTHGDGGGNILMDARGKIYLIDWDDLLLAPRERDTWFYADSEEFLSLYREYFPGYTVNQRVCAYYLYRRFFDDLEGFLDKIFAPTSTDDVKTTNLAGLHKDCYRWLRPLMDRAAESGW
jgi:spectinomycin phosphotransferase